MNEMVVANGGAMAPYSMDALYMPVVAVKQAVERRNMLRAFTESVMVDGRDYGPIPGTGDKKNLLKPGAEKLASWMGLVPDLVIEERVLDFYGLPENGNEPLIYYRVRCDLYKSGVKVGSGQASCSSRESKYRYREGKRKCPDCGQETIYKSKKDGEGWYCWAKKGGCGKTFVEKDPAIVRQNTGKVINYDVADQDNTILKIAGKRALVAAVLICTNVSDYFTQDLEDFAEYRVVTEPTEQDYDAPPAKQESKPNGNGQKQAPSKVSKDTLARLHIVGKEWYGEERWETERPKIVANATKGVASSSKDLTEKEALFVIEALEKRIRGRNAAALVADAEDKETNFMHDGDGA